MRNVLLCLPFVMVCLTGCAAVDPRPDFQRVQGHVAEATGAELPDQPEPDEAIGERTLDKLADGLTVQEAAQVCLLNNPRVRSVWLSVGLARADVVQAGLFRNPNLSLALRFPDGGGLSNFEATLAQSIADLWLIPIRRRVAEDELEQRILEVGRAISVVILDVRSAYFRAVSADREHELALQNRALAQQLVDAALARQQAGVGNEIDVNLARTELMLTEVAVRNAGLTAFESRRTLAGLLGLRMPPENLRLTDPLPEPPAGGLQSDRLIRLAEAYRLDLQAAAQVVQAAEARFKQEQLSVFNQVEVGVALERAERRSRGGRNWFAEGIYDSLQSGGPTPPSLQPREQRGTDFTIGPSLSLDLPIFDQNQAQMARAKFLLRQAVLDREALLLDVEQETRAAVQHCLTAAGLVRYHRDNILPLLETNLGLAREAYRAGTLSLVVVLEAQKALVNARWTYLEAMRDAAVARAELEKAVGRPLEGLLDTPVDTSSMPSGAGA